ncbi:MAG: flippase [Chloroflexota bacterium]|nr:flippase [Chloroflexota bacterium]
MEPTYHRFAKDFVIVGITNILGALSGIALVAVLSKTLGAHGYGIWAQVQVTIALAVSFATLGLPPAITRFLPARTDKSEIQDEVYSAFSLIFLISLLSSLVIVALANPIANTFFEGNVDIVRITGLIIMVWALVTALLSYFRAFRQVKRLSVLILMDLCGQLGLSTLLVLNGYDILHIVLGLLAVRSAVLITAIALLVQQIGFKKPHFHKLREYLDFGVFIIPAAVGGWVVNMSDRYVIGYFLGTASVGIYSAAYTIGNIPMMVTTMLSLILPPAVSKLYDEGKIDEVRQYLTYTFKYFLAIGIPFIFGSAILAKPILTMLSTPEIAREGYFILPLVAIGTVFFGTSIVAHQALPLARKSRLIGIIWTVTAICNLSLNIVVVPWLGILGAALTTLIAYSFQFILGIYYSWKELPFRIEWAFIAKSVTASAIMTLVVWGISPHGNLATILAIVVGIAIYAIAIILMKGFSREEVSFFKGLLMGT